MPATIRGADSKRADPAQMAKVLGNVADWKITPEKPVLGSGPGQPTLVATATEAITLEGNAPVAAPSECLVVYRMKPPEGNTSYVNVQMACADRPDKTPQSVTFSVGANGGQKSIVYSITVLGGKAPPPPLSGSLFFEAVSERSLTWSEEMRKCIEVQIGGAPKVNESLLTLRCTVEKSRCRIWVNGRFSGEVALPSDMDPSGLVKVQATAGAEIASIQVRPLTDVSNRFEPLSIAGHLNSSTVNGDKVDHASLPGLSDYAKALRRDGERHDEVATASQAGALVDNVPFQFPAPSAKGDDHIDVGTSWTRFGALPGWFGSNAGPFGGRWMSTDRIDPSRIAMYVPKGRYKALHLIAVSDDRKDGVPLVTAQFYRPESGHPVNFTGTIPPKGDGDKAQAVPIKLAGGKSSKLYHVTIPLDPDSFSWFSDLNKIGLELTKQVQYYRGYPDPLEYSYHGGGLPSSVQIYAMTLERADVDVDIQPGQVGHVWTAPAAPSYTVQLRNSTGAATTAKLVIKTKSYDGKDETKQEQEVKLPADGSPVTAKIALKPTRYGLHEMTLELKAGDETATYRRNFAYLHPDTRDHTPWEDGRGSIFGYYGFMGGHATPPVEWEIPVMAAAGAETCIFNYSQTNGPPATAFSPEVRALAEKHHFISESAFDSGAQYYTVFKDMFAGGDNMPVLDRADPEGSGRSLVNSLKKLRCEPGPLSRPTYMTFFGEMQIGPITMGIWPSHYGEDYKLTKDEQAMYENYLMRYLIGARALRKEWPDLKLLLPYGDAMNTVVFLKLSPEIREFVDGVALDMPGFERMPEQQVNQVVFSRMCPIMKDMKEYKKNPYLMLIEGFCVASKDLDTSEEEQAQINTRDFLVLMGYGVNRFESSTPPYDCADYWGENHYGGGLSNRIPVATPKLAYVNYATISRHLNRANFTKFVPTGSTSTYCQQFKHYKTGKLVHVLWAIRGKRAVNVKVPAGSSLEIYDQNDNPTTLKEKNGVVTFTVDQSPQYLEGLAADAEVTLGEIDHSDSQPSKEVAKLGNLGDGSWKLVEKEDKEYAKNKPLQIERFLGKMNAKPTDAPGAQGGKALAIHLEKQEKDRGVMPFYTTLEPKKPITIEGKASHLGLWVQAASDWGRVVYVLRDAKGEKWVSVGTKEEWNNDDIHAWSSFCFDGWRYVKFEMPSSLPYDQFREHGTTWWGSYEGDGVVDLPLKLEKVIIERRPKVIYGNDLVAAKPDDVLLGDLNAEYASASDRGDEVVRLSKLHMPVPKNVPELGNPIADMVKTGVGAPITGVKVVDPRPGHLPDGTCCNVKFDLVPDAKSYDVWVSPYADGRGAMKLAAGWTVSNGVAAGNSGNFLEGLRPDVEFYVFAVYIDKDGKMSKPSAAVPFKLKDMFGYK